jgi:glutathione S-transferase
VFCKEVRALSFENWREKNRFMQKNPSGMLPVVEIDGQMMSDSIRIMQVCSLL